MYDRAQLNAAMVRQEEAAQIRGQARPMRDGRRVAQIDAALYHQARIQNQKDYGMRDCWTSNEFLRDQMRRCPAIAVQNDLRGDRIAARHAPDRPVLTRFGRPSFHKVYG